MKTAIKKLKEFSTKDMVRMSTKKRLNVVKAPGNELGKSKIKEIRSKIEGGSVAKSQLEANPKKVSSKIRKKTVKFKE